MKTKILALIFSGWLAGLPGCATAPEQTKDTDVIETLWNMGCDIDSYAKSERMKSLVVKCK